jgi:ElaB/YqjD/DUF883 family membrane-anchored ribosome-binding protein
MEPTQASTKPGTRLNDRTASYPIPNQSGGPGSDMSDEDMALLSEREALAKGGRPRTGALDTEPMDVMVQREDIEDNLRDRDDIQRQSQSSRQQTMGSGGQSRSDEMSKFRADLDDFVARIPGLSDIDLNAAKDKLMETLASSRQSAMNYASEARQQINQKVEATGEYVKEKPMQSIGIAAGVGFLLGLLVSRR